MGGDQRSLRPLPTPPGHVFTSGVPEQSTTGMPEQTRPGARVRPLPTLPLFSHPPLHSQAYAGPATAPCGTRFSKNQNRPPAVSGSTPCDLSHSLKHHFSLDALTMRGPCLTSPAHLLSFSPAQTYPHSTRPDTGLTVRTDVGHARPIYHSRKRRTIKSVDDNDDDSYESELDDLVLSPLLFSAPSTTQFVNLQTKVASPDSLEKRSLIENKRSGADTDLKQDLYPKRTEKVLWDVQFFNHGSLRNERRNHRNLHHRISHGAWYKEKGGKRWEQRDLRSVLTELRGLRIGR